MSLGPLHCLERRYYSYEELCKHLDVKPKDRRFKTDTIDRFIRCNRDIFSFLGIDAVIEQSDGEIGISIATDKYVGCVPLISPTTGLPFQNLLVKPRFGESPEELAYLLEETVTPDYCGFELFESNRIPAPMYLECINYFNAFKKAIETVWNKFDVVVKKENVPSGSTDWKRYIESSYDPSRTLVFENRKNVQSKDHLEWHQLTYIAKIALDLFLTHKTPANLKFSSKQLTDKLTYYVANHTKSAIDKPFVIRGADPMIIRQLKAQANIIISRRKDNRLAWRIDIAELFERYVQYLLSKVAMKTGARCVSNGRISVYGSKPKWCQNYLEPDIMLVSDQNIIMADAKYKAHMLNTFNDSPELKDTFRHDLHQLLAYTSFDNSTEKTAVLIYPHSFFRKNHIRAGGGISRTNVNVYLIGVPVCSEQSKIKEIVDNLYRTIGEATNYLED